MTQTRRITTTGNQWNTVATGATFCVIQMQSQGRLRVAVAETAPPNGHIGILLNDYGLRELSLAGIAETDSVFAYPIDNDEEIVVVDNGTLT
jgi:hypothetical protein